MTIRGLSQIFKKIDMNKNRQIDLEELSNGLNFFGISLNDKQCEALLKHFDKDGSGGINFDEFISTLRVSTFSITQTYLGTCQRIETFLHQSCLC